VKIVPADGRSRAPLARRTMRFKLPSEGRNPHIGLLREQRPFANQPTCLSSLPERMSTGL
jgi:hypothetical protein